MLFIAAVDAADSVLKFPERSVAPPEDRPLSIVGKGNFTGWFLRHDTVKSLGGCHCDLTFLPHVFRAAVGGDLETGALLQSRFLLAQIFYHIHVVSFSFHITFAKASSKEGGLMRNIPKPSFIKVHHEFTEFRTGNRRHN